ncbi:LINE-1 reverse transcriptase isogeny [Gossypium australe]|uniref:LINE-1 reverse transcriptase isogeny n=1 Tax=Gossypium australe TaxID=47621 RepID=A0A5B6WF97_9ROSI|nr:LINE-1 reverse transcriptase isogeny [Gossypium australe]
MTIKIDLEKEYDRVRWDFIDASLKAASIPDFLRNVIMSAITSQWSPIWLFRSGSSLFHVFFADDLVIFGKANLSQGRLINEILDEFCSISGHRVNAHNTSIFFSKGVGEDLAGIICNLLRFRRVHNIGKYLGVPLFHERVTLSSLRFVVEKSKSRLQRWDARQLSLVGRVTLAQSVLLTIPSYFMQSMMIPQGTCDEIESIVRQFIWGPVGGSKKMALISWNSLCQPNFCGGLGFRQLKDQNTSFLLKLGFNILANSEALWVRVLQSKYRMKDGVPPCISRRNYFFL